MLVAEKISADLDLRYNYLALQIALLASDYITPEQAMLTVGIAKVREQTGTPRRGRFTKQDIESIMLMRERGWTWRELGEIYGASRQTMFYIVNQYKKRKELSLHEAYKINSQEF